MAQNHPPQSNIHAREYRLYLPGKDELQKKLVEWAEDYEADNVVAKQSIGTPYESD